MDDAVGSIIEHAMSLSGNTPVPKDTNMKMQKFTITETAYSQLEVIRLKAHRIQFPELISILVDSAYQNGESLVVAESEGRSRKWYVKMDPEVRGKLDELCKASGVSPGCMLNSIIGSVSNYLNGLTTPVDIREAVADMPWGEPE